MRCFIAIDLPEEIKQEILNLQKLLPEGEMKLVAEDNMHLTLQFLGEITPEQVEECRKALSKIKFSKFTASLGKLGVFSEDHIRILWLALEPENIITELHNLIHNSLKDIVKLDERFQSHITLARVNRIKDRKEFLDKFSRLKVKPLEFHAGKFTLKKSTLTEKGPIYEDIAEFMLF